MRNKIFAIALGGMIALGAQAALYAQDPAPPQSQTPGGQQEQQSQWGHGQGRGHRMDPDRQLQHLTKALDLTADQQSQIKPILTDRQQKMQALWKDQSLSREDRHAKAQAIQQDTQTRLEATLNDQQKQKFEEMRAKMMERRQHGTGGPNQAPATAPQPE